MIGHRPEFVAQVRALRDAGMPTAEIGKRLGVTKNVVVGIAHRQGFTPRAKSVKPQIERVDERSERGCRWIAGDPKEVRRGVNIWCCEPTTGPGEPYCAEHRARAYVAVAARVGKVEAA